MIGRFAGNGVHAHDSQNLAQRVESCLCDQQVLLIPVNRLGCLKKAILDVAYESFPRFLLHLIEVFRADLHAELAVLHGKRFR